MTKDKIELPARFLSFLGVSERAWARYSPMGGARQASREESTDYGMGIQVRGNVIHLDGIIVSDSDAEFLEFWFGIGAISPARFREALESLEGEVEFRLNSPGGQIAAEVSIRSVLMDWRETPGNRVKEIRVVGLAASAGASLLYTSQATKITTLSSSVIMIHQAQFGYFDAKGLRQQADVIEGMTEGSIRQYAKARRKDEAEVREDVMAETWMESSMAVERGYADEELESVEEADADGEDDGDGDGGGDDGDSDGADRPGDHGGGKDKDKDRQTADEPVLDVEPQRGDNTDGAAEPPQQPARRRRRLAWR